MKTTGPSSLLRHQGVKSGRIVQKTSQILRLSDGLRYDLGKSTRWVKGGLESAFDDFNVRDIVFVKSKALSPSGPMALTVADTAEGAESTRADTLKNAGPKVDPRPAPGSPSGDLPTPGSGDLPAPGSSYNGVHRPASTDARLQNLGLSEDIGFFRQRGRNEHHWRHRSVR